MQRKIYSRSTVAEWRRRGSISSQRNRFSWQQRKNNWYQNHSELKIPKQPHHGRCSTTAWIEKRKSRRPSFWAQSSGSQQQQRISKLDSQNERWRLHQHQINCLSKIDQQSAFASCKCQQLDKISGSQSCGPKLQSAIHRRLDNWSRTLWRVDDWRQQNQGTSKTNHLPPILFWLARDWAWEPTWKEEYSTSVFFLLFWTRQFTAILGDWRDSGSNTVDIRKTEMWRSLQKYHLSQLSGKI